MSARREDAIETIINTAIAELGDATPIGDLLDACSMMSGDWSLDIERYCETRIRAIRGW